MAQDPIAIPSKTLGFWPGGSLNFSQSDVTQPLPALILRRYNDIEADLVVCDSAGNWHVAADMLLYPVNSPLATIQANVPCGQWMQDT